MFNENVEMYETNDFDTDVNEKKELIEEAKKLAEDENADYNEAVRLQKRFRRIPSWESAYDEDLEEEFNKYVDVVFSKRREQFVKNEELKKELIKKANDILNSDNFNKMTQEMNDLMEKWKEIGSAGRELDDQLWESFNAARQKFFDGKHQAWEEMQNGFANAKKVKEDLIVKAKALESSEEWQKTSEVFHDLMSEWKKVGSAGREFENDLWNSFNESRQKFYERRNAFYEALHSEQDERCSKKEELIAQAKEILDSAQFTREHTAQMKEFGVRWKEIGSAGRNKENELWNEFRGIMDAYFAGLKESNERRHQQWRQRLIDARTRKQELVQNQKRQIKHMEEEKVGLLGQRAIDDMDDRIEEKELFIKQLEEEIEDIEKTLEKD